MLGRLRAPARLDEDLGEIRSRRRSRRSTKSVVVREREGPASMLLRLLVFPRRA